MSTHEELVAAAVEEFLGEGPELVAALRQAVIDELVVDLAPAEDDQWPDEWWPEIGEVVSRQVATQDGWAEQVRESCQVSGEAQLGQVGVRINTTFINRTSAVEVRRRQLASWPTSPHWWVELVTPDGDTTRYTNDQLGSWVDVVLEADRTEIAWVDSERRRTAGLLRVIERAAAAVTAAEQAVKEALAARDEAILDALDGGVEGTRAATAARVSKQRVYQLAASRKQGVDR